MHFPAEDEMRFDAEPFSVDSLTGRLADRRPGESALAALGDRMATRMTQAESGRSELSSASGRYGPCVRTSSAPNPSFGAAHGAAAITPFEEILADAIGTDLGQNGNNLLPRVAALSAVAGLRELYESDEALTLGSPPQSVELLALVDRVATFVRAGVEAGR